MKRFVALAALLLAGCISKPPPLLPPDRVESFCGEIRPDAAEIAAILSSVSDRIEPSRAYPGDAAVRFNLTHNGGAIGHWTGQQLYMPGTAAVFGVAGNYVTITSVAIDNQLAGTESRLIYAMVDTPEGSKGVVLRAYDTSNVCSTRSDTVPAAAST